MRIIYKFFNYFFSSMIPPLTVAILFVGSILLFPEFYKQLHYRFVVLSVIAKLAIIYLILWVVGFIRYDYEKKEVLKDAHSADFNDGKIKSIIFYLFMIPLSSFEIISVTLLILGLGYVVISYVDFVKIIILDLYNWVF